MPTLPTKHLHTSVLDIAYEEQGDPHGPPLVLLHGFPDDVRAWDAVIPPLVAAGYRTLAPYTRGYGPTRFLSETTPRSGQLAACTDDVRAFVDGLGLDRFVLVGHDWGARSAQAIAALSPERVAKLVSFSGYSITWGAAGGPPSYPQMHALWYQWVFNLEIGRFLLLGDRRGFCRYLWETWSPTWHVDEVTFAATAPSFDNPDFVDITINGYRHGYGNYPGDPQYADAEAALATGPSIAVPSVVLLGADDALDIGGASANGDAAHFTGAYDRHVLPGVGHFPHRERPEAVVRAILS